MLLFEKWVLASFYFITFYFLSFYFFTNSLLNGRLDKKYENLSYIHNTKDFENVNRFLKNYQNEILILSTLNMVKEYQASSKIKFDMSNIEIKEIDNSDTYVNKLKFYYNNLDYTKEFKIYVDNAIATIVMPKLVIFPIELQPYFVSNKIISNFSYEFSVIAIGVKIYIIDFFIKIKYHFNIISLSLLFTLALLTSFYLTKLIIVYNQKYDKSKNFKMTLFFMTVSTFGFLLSLISLIID